MLGLHLANARLVPVPHLVLLNPARIEVCVAPPQKFHKICKEICMAFMNENEKSRTTQNIETQEV